MIELDLEEPKITNEEELIDHIQRLIPSKGITLDKIIRLTIAETKKFILGNSQ